MRPQAAQHGHIGPRRMTHLCFSISCTQQCPFSSWEPMDLGEKLTSIHIIQHHPPSAPRDPNAILPHSRLGCWWCRWQPWRGYSSWHGRCRGSHRWNQRGQGHRVGHLHLARIHGLRQPPAMIRSQDLWLKPIIASDIKGLDGLMNEQRKFGVTTDVNHDQTLVQGSQNVCEHTLLLKSSRVFLILIDP